MEDWNCWSSLWKSLYYLSSSWQSVSPSARIGSNRHSWLSASDWSSSRSRHHVTPAFVPENSKSLKIVACLNLWFLSAVKCIIGLCVSYLHIDWRHTLLYCRKAGVVGGLCPCVSHGFHVMLIVHCLPFWGFCCHSDTLMTSQWTASALCLALAIGYVAPFYVTRSLHPRNHPQTIIRRACSTSASCMVATIPVYYYLGSEVAFPFLSFTLSLALSFISYWDP